jgi:dolichol-phosphate mannosyltransferase
MIELSIVIPVKDEEKIIPSLIERISSAILDLKITFEIIFVTDINKDHTVDVLQYFSEKNQRIKTIKLANCFGQHVAVMAGLDYSQGNYVVIMDGDLQDFPEDIPLLYRKITEGYDIVYAVKQKKNDSFFRNLSSRTFNSLMNLFSDINRPVIQACSE